MLRLDVRSSLHDEVAEEVETIVFPSVSFVLTSILFIPRKGDHPNQEYYRPPLLGMNICILIFEKAHQR